jgi:transposase
VITDNLKTHTSAGSLLVRSMLTELQELLYLVYTPAYDPDANRIEWHRPRFATGRDAYSSPQHV